MENKKQQGKPARSLEGNQRRKEKKKQNKTMKRKRALSMLSVEKGKVEALEERLENSNKKK